MGTHPIFESDFDCLTDMVDYECNYFWCPSENNIYTEKAWLPGTASHTYADARATMNSALAFAIITVVQMVLASPKTSLAFFSSEDDDPSLPSGGSGLLSVVVAALGYCACHYNNSSLLLANVVLSGIKLG